MALLESEVDAHFFNLVHELAGSREGAEDGERRDVTRQPFGSTQRIAPYTGPNIPPASMFSEVRCHDLTQQGFSFLLPKRPAYKKLVASFGPAKTPIYAAAQVVALSDVLVSATGLLHKVDDSAAEGLQSEEIASNPEFRDAVPMVLIHCEFTRRLEQM